MSSDRNSRDPTPPSPTRRRSSFVDMFNPRASMSSQNQGSRRLSITTLGLSTLPGAQSSPFGNMRNRAESISSANSGSVDESPFEDDAASSPSAPNSSSVPQTPFRRMSFGGARTLNGRTAPTSAAGGSTSSAGSANGNGRAPGSSASSAFANSKASASSPSGAKSREGFDFAENMRARAERSSISSGAFGGIQMNNQPHNRSKSIANMEPPKSELPKQARPDAFQERILKGDFYMD